MADDEDDKDKSRQPVAGGVAPQSPNINPDGFVRGKGEDHHVMPAHIFGADNFNRDLIEKLQKENAVLEKAHVALESLNVGVVSTTGNLMRYDQNEGLKETHKVGNEDYAKQAEDISLMEISRVSDTSMSGSKWDDKTIKEHTATRERVKEALDIDGSGDVTAAEIKEVVRRLGSKLTLDADALAITLNTGSLPRTPTTNTR